MPLPWVPGLRVVQSHPTWRINSRDTEILHHLMQFQQYKVRLCVLFHSLEQRWLSKGLVVMSSSRLSKQSAKSAEKNLEPIFFFSGSRLPYCQFSNFYEVDIEMPEGVFPSVEHYFQGMKFIPEDRERFMKGGEFDKKKTETSARKAREEIAKGRLAKSAGSKSGSAKYKLTLTADGLDQEVAKHRMKGALQRKFEREPYKSLLLETVGTQLIHIPTRGQTDFWTGKRDNKTGEIVGQNTMGKLLMEVRDAMLG